VLEFNICNKIGLAGLRVDVTSFIRLTYDLLEQSMIVIRIKTNSGETKDEYAMSLELLRKRCFVFISDMMVNRSAQRYQQCPSLWIDGYGTVLGTDDHFIDSSQHRGYVSNSHAKVNDTELLKTGLEYAKDLERRPAPMRPARNRMYMVEAKSDNATELQTRSMPHYPHPNQALRECDDLHSMWVSLKDLDWPSERDRQLWEGMN
jgi:hypothetical protein